jgi:hypothetical protein
VHGEMNDAEFAERLALELCLGSLILGKHALHTQDPTPTVEASSVRVSELFSIIVRGLDDVIGIRLENLPATREEVVDASRALGSSRSVLLTGGSIKDDVRADEIITTRDPQSLKREAV